MCLSIESFGFETSVLISEWWKTVLLFNCVTIVIRIIDTLEQIKLNIIIKLSVVFIECETWSLTLRKKHRQRVFENRLLRKMFGPKNEDIRGERRILRESELHI